MTIKDPSEIPPLQGLRVVEFGQYIAVPAAAQMLCDLGADVIKVESTAGDAARYVGWTQDSYGPMFSAYNRGKRSVVLDLRTVVGRQQALALACSADVVLQNVRPGIMERQGLGALRLMEMTPRLVYGQVSGFGQQGPASVRPGLDIAAQAESGMMSLNGDADRDPTRVGFTVVDVMAAQVLSNGVLASLVRRGVTGRGGLVDVSLIDVAVSALANAWTEYHLSGRMPLRRGNIQPNSAPAADVIRTADGMIVVSAYTQDHFAKLCAAIGATELALDPRFRENAGRVENRPALMDVLGNAMSHMTSDQVCDLLASAGVVAGVIRTMADVKAGQAGVSSDLFVEVTAPDRVAVRVPSLPMSLCGVHRRAGRLPALGEHTQEVLSTLNF
jgi:crotonobetainyl-CoA:carnitine CoA-transferase CaiB-like acyl-CoA transferase